MASNEAVVFCQAADTVTTLQAIKLGGQEANPVVERILEEFGPGGFVAAKVGVTLLFLHYYPQLSADLVRTVNGLTCAVAAHNAMITTDLERKKPPGGKPPDGQPKLY